MNTEFATVTKTEVDTKENKHAESVATILTIKWNNMTPADVQALAQQALVIKLQASWRKNGIPAGEFEVNAEDHKVGTRAKRAPADPAKLIAQMSPEAQREFLLAQLAKLGG